MIITGNYFPRRHIFPFQAFTNAALARRFCESSRHICRFYFEEPHQQLCVNKISNLKTFTIYKSTHHCVFSKFLPPLFSLGGDTPFCTFGYEIINFYLINKKTTICEQFPLVQNGRALFIKVSLFLFQDLSEFFAMQIFPQHCLHGQSKIL